MWGTEKLSSIGANAMGKRPPHVKPPAHWTKGEAPPEPAAPREAEESGGPKGVEPTRYGDWENHGRCWDF
jgi:hypothetical protein